MRSLRVAGMMVGALHLLPVPAHAGDLFEGRSVLSKVGSFPFSVASGDLNGDGRQDLVTSSYYDATVSVLIGHGDGTFEPQATIDMAGPFNFQVVIADLDGDGRQDLVVSSGVLSVLLGRGDGTIAAVDSDGVALAAIQALLRRLEELERRLAAPAPAGEDEPLDRAPAATGREQR